jgi:DNA-binding transcriptional LysR family regulator
MVPSVAPHFEALSAVQPGLLYPPQADGVAFLSTPATRPKGVVPTARATELAPRIADVLSRVRSVISTAEPFDPATSTRRFTIGAPDGVSAVFLPPLLAELRQTAPGTDISVRQLLPLHGETSPERAWRSAFAELEARAMDIAVVPSDDIAARFLKRKLYEEDFVAVMRAGPFGDDPTLDRYR